MTDVDSRACGPLGRFIRAFYDARRAASRTGDLSVLHPFMAADVRWSEPDVGAHMGVLEGRDAVLDMIRRALDTTGGSFDLRVCSTAETSSHVAASVAWSAVKESRRIEGQELAVFEVREARIVAASFHPGPSPTTRRSGEKTNQPDREGSRLPMGYERLARWTMDPLRSLKLSA